MFWIDTDKALPAMNSQVVMFKVNLAGKYIVKGHYDHNKQCWHTESGHYIIILDADEARRFHYLLRHPNVEEIQRKLKACNDALAKMNYRENEDGTTSFDIDLEV